MSQFLVPFTIDDILKATGIGSINKAILNNLYGFNHQKTPPPVPKQKVGFGYTFFTRPQLNLQSANIRNIREFYDLLNDQDVSIQRFVRTTLDPRLQYGYTMDGSKVLTNKLNSPLVDKFQPFIPILSNNLISLTGFPDVVAPVWTSDRGLKQQVTSQIDGTTDIYYDYDVTATFRNTIGSPILYLFYTWIKYASYVYESKLVPYPDFIYENEYDYNTRIYRILTDHTRQYVTHILACGVSFPSAVPIGSQFDYSDEKPYNFQLDEISIKFNCLGLNVLDPILMYEFNKIVETFNPSMKSANRSSMMTAIPYSQLKLFNFQGYPYIDYNVTANTNVPTTTPPKLEWYVFTDLFKAKVNSISNLPSTSLTSVEKSLLDNNTPYI